MTVTPAAGFVGWMAIRVSVQQTTATPPNANDFVDRQINPYSGSASRPIISTRALR